MENRGINIILCGDQTLSKFKAYMEKIDNNHLIIANVDITPVIIDTYCLEQNTKISYSSNFKFDINAFNHYRDKQKCSHKDKIPSYIKLNKYNQNILGYNNTSYKNDLVVKNTKKYYKDKKVNRRRQKNKL